MTNNKKVKKDGKWYVYSEDGEKKLGGPYDTEKEADERLKQVEHFKQKKNELVRMTSKITPTVRSDNMEGKSWTVVPMVMLVEGVHNGSCGALYYPAEELEKTPQSWNHKPVVVYHPDGPTACDPDVLTNRKIGVIMNTKWENGKLKAEAWLDSERMKKVDNRVAEAVEKKEMLELSTGLFTDTVGPGGTWNEEEYDAIAINYRPDHLAVLPDMIGACSTKDGAGFLRTNSEKKKENSIADSWAVTYFPILQAAGIDTDKLTANELSHGEVWRQLQSEIERKQPKNEDGFVKEWYYIHEVYSDYVVYEGAKGKLYKQSYEVKEDVVTLTGVSEEVIRVVTYKSVTNETGVNNVKNTKDNKMDKNELIKKLTSNEMSGWTEKDKDVLESMTEKQLETLVQKISEKKNAEIEKKTEDVKPEVKNAEPEKKVEKKEEKVEVKNAEPEKKPLTTEEYIASAPAEIQSVWNEMRKVFNGQKDALIASILSNKACDFTKEFLQTKSMDELRGLAKLAGMQKKTEDAVPMFNYSGQQDAANTTNADVEILDLPTMTFEQK